jgi:hypothetical protein
VRLHYYRVTAPGAGIVGDIPVQIRFDFSRCRLDFLS